MTIYTSQVPPWVKLYSVTTKAQWRKNSRKHPVLSCSRVTVSISKYTNSIRAGLNILTSFQEYIIIII